MEVIVSVEAEDVVWATRRRTSDAFLVYVALDDQGQPRPVPPLVVETPEQRDLWRAAEVRREARLKARP
jgi:acyl-CoA hydrolase